VDLAAELHANYAHALGRITALSPGAAAERIGDWLCVDAAVDVDEFNIATPVRRVAGGREPLAEARAWFAARNRRWRAVLRADSDAELVAAALHAGYREGEREPIMLLDSLDGAAWTADELHVRRVVSDRDILDFAESEPADSGDIAIRDAITRSAFGMPGCTMFVGTAGGVPVGRSMAVLTGRVAGVYNVYVRPEWRGRGFGAALTGAVIDCGRAAGCTVSCLGATELGLPVYRRMGYRVVDHYLSLWLPV
jgi:GNAT superfamily N-acetyltransferase